MKTKNLFGILMLFLCVFSFYSCKDDDQIPQFEFTPESISVPLKWDELNN